MPVMDSFVICILTSFVSWAKMEQIELSLKHLKLVWEKNPLYHHETWRFMNNPLKLSLINIYLTLPSIKTGLLKSGFG